MIGSGKFRFLNETRELSFPEGWNDPAAEKLWLYNLHYFEDLTADGAGERVDWHCELVEQWIAGNPPFEGSGWEPYPVSLRICNWVKWALQEYDMEESWLRSLALQAEYLYHRIEWHLLGNHVFENARALVLAGLYFEGPRAERWRAKGLRILDRQLHEQILPDGGHFERSPMYHALVLEGVLDLVQVSEHFSLNHEQIAAWRAIASRMLAWMHNMSHPDGEISFFNDAVFDIGLPATLLFEYAVRLDIPQIEKPRGEGMVLLEDSGYVRADRGPFTMLLDVAPVGPDHQPGHAHADTLSFELSVRGQRVLVNSGTSVYGLSEERLRQRGTAAHNTVVVDGEDSSEVWSGFRVARRARPFGIAVRGNGEVWLATAAHDGYRRLPGNVTHRRNWRLGESSLAVEDELSGEYRTAVAYFFFHPDVRVEMDDCTWSILLADGNALRLSVTEGTGELIESSYHPQFGDSIANSGLRVSLKHGRSRLVLEYPIEP